MHDGIFWEKVKNSLYYPFAVPKKSTSGCRVRQEPATRLPSGLSFMCRVISKTHITYNNNKADNYAALR